jgi:hypothetical protein
LPLAEPLAHKSEKRMTFMDVSGKSKNYRYSKSSINHGPQTASWLP